MTRLPTRVLVFVPYALDHGREVSPHYDVPEYRAEVEGWMRDLNQDWEWVPITAGSLAGAVARAKALKENTGNAENVLVLNLCDGTTTDGFPGIDVVTALWAQSIPFTGAGADFYRLTTSKAASKTRFRTANVPTADWVLARTMDDVDRAAATLNFPLFVKPDVSAGSYGIQIESVVRDLPAARRRVQTIQAGLHGQTFEDDAVLIETFIEGREFSVLVVEDPDEALGLYVLTPGERVFDPRVPSSERFLAFERYWGLPEITRPIPPGEPYYWYQLAPPELRESIVDIARRAFRAVGGEGYARVDLRLDERSGQLMVLEVNAQCGLSSSDSSTVGSILTLCGQRMTPIIERIIRHGMTR